MKISNWLAQATKQLTEANIATARLDCLVLLEDALHKDRAHLLAHPELELTVEQEKVLNQQIARRIKHEPLAYIRGKTEFYGRDFVINKDVLEPRPETEDMIDLLRLLPHEQVQTVIDVGTGSGAIAITVALEFVTVQVLATDIDPNCLAVARKNCVKHKATVDLIKTDLIKILNLPKESIIVANLPYVPNKYQVNQAAQMEPKLAIYGGEDGLDLYRKLFRQIDKQPHKPGYVLTEALPPSHNELATIAAQHGYNLHQTKGFIQLFTTS